MPNTRRRFMTGTGALIASAGAARAFAQDIFQAAATGNMERAKELCKEVPGIVNLRSDDGRTALHFAAAGGQPEMVMFLNGQGADLSAGPESPILAITDYPDPAVAEEMARTLLGNGSNPNAARKDGTTALQVAVARGNLAVARMLIHRGARVDAAVPDADKIERVYFGQRYTQDLRGNKVTRDDTNGLPQAYINEFVTIAHFDTAKVKQMHKLCPALLSTRATWDELAIEAAAHMGIVPLAEYLADAGAPVSTCTAAILGLTDTVGKMVRADGDVLRERGAHDLPLLAFTAFGTERAEIAALLLESGADANALAFGQTTLHIAAGKGYIEVARTLLEHGAEINAIPRGRKGPGPTPLAVALERKQQKMAEFLSGRGART